MVKTIIKNQSLLYFFYERVFSFMMLKVRLCKMYGKSSGMLAIDVFDQFLEIELSFYLALCFL